MLEAVASSKQNSNLQALASQLGGTDLQVLKADHAIAIMIKHHLKVPQLAWRNIRND